MTQEEKAKAYDEALEKAKECHEKYWQVDAKFITETLFPELRESEDERIRKEMIEFFQCSMYCDDLDTEKIKRWVTYLEKQKEQKPVKWNDADMREARDNLISVCRDWERGEQTTLLPIVASRARYFLEHLIEPQKPVEWGEEDKKMRDSIPALID